MGFLDSIIAFALLPLGSWILYVLCRSLLDPVVARVRGSSRSTSLSKTPRGRYARQIAKIDKHISSDNYKSALKDIEKALTLDVGKSESQVRQIRDHNQTVLSRAIIVSEHYGGRIHNLPDVERLLLERAEAQLLHIKTKSSFQEVSKKRGRRGKAIPEWGSSEFKKKLAAIETKLAENKRELEEALKSFFTAIRTPRSNESDITYH